MQAVASNPFQLQQLPPAELQLERPLSNDDGDFLLKAIDKIKTGNDLKNAEPVIDLLIHILNKDFEKVAKHFSELNKDSLSLLPENFGNDLINRIALHVNNEKEYQTLNHLIALFTILNILIENRLIDVAKIDVALESLLSSDFAYEGITLENLNQALNTVKAFNFKRALFDKFYLELLEVAAHHLENSLRGQIEDKNLHIILDILTKMMACNFEAEKLNRLYRAILRKVVHQQNFIQLENVAAFIVSHPTLIENSQYAVLLLMKALFDQALKNPKVPALFIQAENLLKRMLQFKLKDNGYSIILSEFIIKAIAQKLPASKWGSSINIVSKMKNLEITSKTEIPKILTTLLNEVRETSHYQELYALCAPLLPESAKMAEESERKEHHAVKNVPWWLEPSSTTLLKGNIALFLTNPNEEKLEHIVATFQDIKEPLSAELILSMISCILAAFKDKKLFSQACSLFLSLLNQENLKEISPEKLHALCHQFTQNFPENREYLGNDNFVRLINFCLTRLNQPDQFIPFIELGRKFKNVSFLQTVWLAIKCRNFGENEQQSLFLQMIQDLDLKRLRSFTLWKDLTPNLCLLLAQKLILLGSDYTHQIDLPPLLEKGKNAHSGNKAEFIAELCKSEKNIPKALQFFEEMVKDNFYLQARKQILIALSTSNNLDYFKKAIVILKQTNQTITDEEIHILILHIDSYPMAAQEAAETLLYFLPLVKQIRLKREILAIITKKLSEKLPLSLLIQIANALLPFKPEDIKSFDLPIVVLVLEGFDHFVSENLNLPVHLRHSHQNFGLAAIKLYTHFKSVIDISHFKVRIVEAKINQILELAKNKESEGALKQAVDHYFSDLIYIMPMDRILDPPQKDANSYYLGINRSNGKQYIELFKILNRFDVTALLDYADQLDFFGTQGSWEDCEAHILHRFSLELGVLDTLFVLGNGEKALVRLQKFADIVSTMKELNDDTFNCCCGIFKRYILPLSLLALEKGDLNFFQSFYISLKKIIFATTQARKKDFSPQANNNLKIAILIEIIILSFLFKHIKESAKKGTTIKNIIIDLLKNKEKFIEKIRELTAKLLIGPYIREGDIKEFYLSLMSILRYPQMEKIFAGDQKTIVKMIQFIFREIDFKGNKPFKKAIETCLQD